jgi:dihydrofolate reductase
MRKLVAFNNVTLDGYFTDANGDMSWAHSGPKDAEFEAFVAGNAKGGGVLVFGRITYEMMACYWPTPLASANNPVVAERMNNLPKIVFSRTLGEASWSNTRLVKGDLAAAMRELKSETGPDMVILGSGSIIAQLSDHRLIDAYQVVLNPVVIGKGRTMFDGMTGRLNLKLATSRNFGGGKVFLSYELAT